MGNEYSNGGWPVFDCPPVSQFTPPADELERGRSEIISEQVAQAMTLSQPAASISYPSELAGQATIIGCKRAGDIDLGNVDFSLSRRRQAAGSQD